MKRLVPTVFAFFVLVLLAEAAPILPGATESQWNGYTRYNFKFQGYKCFITEPTKALPSKPWIWRAKFPGYHDEVDEILVGYGFHVAYINCGAMLGSPKARDLWDEFYKHVTEEVGLSKVVALEAVSRGGLYAYGWAARNPEKVACIYADSPVLDFRSWPGGKGKGVGSEGEWKNLMKQYGFTEEQAMKSEDIPLNKLAPLAKAGIPIMHIVSPVDRVVPADENSLILEKKYRELGGTVTVLINQKGDYSSQGHHFPLDDPKRYADFIFDNTPLPPLRAEEAPSAAPPSAVAAKQDYDAIVNQRLREGLAYLRENGWPPGHSDFIQYQALLKLFLNEEVEEANQQVMTACGQKPGMRREGLLRIYLMERTNRLLTREAREAIEDFAWNTLEAYNGRCKREHADRSPWEINDSENHYLNDRRRTLLALAIVQKSERYGPDKEFDGHPVKDHYQAWVQFWFRYFRSRALEGTDLEFAHHGSYGDCSIGVYYDIHDLIDNAELRKLAADFLTLYWAEVAVEYEPRTGFRAWAQTRMPQYYEKGYWARDLLFCYRWTDIPFRDNFIGKVLYQVSDYRPPEILSAIARDPDRGGYLSASRRGGMMVGEGMLGFDENGSSHFRRDVWYTPDYSLSTLSTDPECDYFSALAQTQGATFSADYKSRITVLGTGYYARRATIGLTGPAVSIVARDSKAQVGLDRFKSNGTRVFISNGPLWDNHIEDPSGWFFTRCGDAYTAIRVPGSGYKITDISYSWPNRKLKEIKENRGWFLEFNDMWTPVVIQMGRAKDYDSFEAFQKSVKENPLTYEEDKLTYKSEAGDTYEAWAKFPQMPKINGETLNLNPENTYDSPYLKMKHGTNKAVISHPGYEDVVLEF